MSTDALHLQDTAALFLNKLVLDAKFAHASKSRLAISAGGIVVDAGFAFGNARQHRISMRDRFVARNIDNAFNYPHRGDALNHATP